MKYLLALLFTFSFSFVHFNAFAQDPDYEKESENESSYSSESEDIVEVQSLGNPEDISKEIAEHYFIRYDHLDQVKGAQMEDDILGNAQWKTKFKLNGEIEGLFTGDDGINSYIEFTLIKGIPLDEAKALFQKYKYHLLDEYTDILDHEVIKDEVDDGHWYKANWQIEAVSGRSYPFQYPKMELELKTDYRGGYNINLLFWYNCCVI